MLLYVQRMMQMFVPFEQQAQMPHIPPFPSSPPLEFSLQYDGAALEARLIAPPEFLTALGKYIQATKQLTTPTSFSPTASIAGSGIATPTPELLAGKAVH